MTDIAELETRTLAEIEAAESEAALEAVRVAALGKKGEISALLATLGRMAPDARKIQGAKINALKDVVTERLALRRAALEQKALEARLKAEALDVTLPAPQSALDETLRDAAGDAVEALKKRVEAPAAPTGTEQAAPQQATP